MDLCLNVANKCLALAEQSFVPPQDYQAIYITESFPNGIYRGNHRIFGDLALKEGQDRLQSAIVRMQGALNLRGSLQQVPPTSAHCCEKGRERYRAPYILCCVFSRLSDLGNEGLEGLPLNTQAIVCIQERRDFAPVFWQEYRQSGSIPITVQRE